MFRQELILLVYNKDVICIIDKGKEPVCKVTERPKRRSLRPNDLPSHDPYIPRSNSVLFRCTTEKCERLLLDSLTQLAAPDEVITACFYNNKYVCEIIRYHYLKNVDKLLFLSKNIPMKSFYLVDCLVYSDGGRVCHKKDSSDSYVGLIDTGSIARPNDPSVLSQDEFICEETKDTRREVTCDLNPFVPYEGVLKLKQSSQFADNILLKTGQYVTRLSRVCTGAEWCGYKGWIIQTRRNSAYNPPGGKVYRCYYANKQQICKELYGSDREIYNGRGWISSK